MNDPASPAGSSPGPSHYYDTRWSDVIRNVLMTIAIVLAAGVVALAFGRSGLAPPSSYRSDPDSVIIATKAGLARTADADVAFVGDSSCLVNMDMATLESAGKLRAVNLGTLSYLSIDSFGVLAQEFAQRTE